MIWAWLTKVWCWIVGHNVICLKRYTHMNEEYNTPSSTSSVHQCLRCEGQWEDSWDD